MKNRLQQYPSALPGVQQFGNPAGEQEATSERMVRMFTDCVAEHPTTSLIVMASLGALVGWFLKRR